MLRRIPELQWLTVTQNGMCAEVVVRERPEREPVLDRKTPQNVVASRAGVITEVLCFDGNCLVSPGQAVESGQLLVSAYTDLEFKTQVSAARAENIRKDASVIRKRYSRKRRCKSALPDAAAAPRSCWGTGAFASGAAEIPGQTAIKAPSGAFLRSGWLFPAGRT